MKNNKYLITLFMAVVGLNISTLIHSRMVVRRPVTRTVGKPVVGRRVAPVTRTMARRAVIESTDADIGEVPVVRPVVRKHPITKTIIKKPIVRRRPVTRAAFGRPVVRRRPVTRAAFGRPVVRRRPLTRAAVGRPVVRRRPVTRAAFGRPAFRRR